MRAIDADDLITAFPVGKDEPDEITVSSVRATIKAMPTLDREESLKAEKYRQVAVELLQKYCSVQFQMIWDSKLSVDEKSRQCDLLAKKQKQYLGELDEKLV